MVVNVWLACCVAHAEQRGGPCELGPVVDDQRVGERGDGGGVVTTCGEICGGGHPEHRSKEQRHTHAGRQQRLECTEPAVTLSVSRGVGLSVRSGACAARPTINLERLASVFG